jgi:hypothetical protein
MMGIESADFLKMEKRRLEMTLTLAEPILRQHQPPVDLAALDVVVRDLQQYEDIVAKQSEDKTISKAASESASTDSKTLDNSNSLDTR